MYAHPSDGQQNDPRYPQRQERGEQPPNAGPPSGSGQQAWNAQQQHHQQQQEQQPEQSQQPQQQQQQLWQYQQSSQQQHFFPQVCEEGGSVGHPSIWAFHDLADMPYTTHYPTETYDRSSSSSQPSWHESGIPFGGQGTSSQAGVSGSARTTSNAQRRPDSSTVYPIRGTTEAQAPAAPLFRGPINEPTAFAADAASLSQNINEEARRHQEQWLSHGIESNVNRWPLLAPSEVTRRFHDQRLDEGPPRRMESGVDAPQSTYNPLLQASGLAYSSDSSAGNTTQERANLSSRLSHPAAATWYRRASSSDTQVSSSNQSEESPTDPHASTSAHVASSASSLTDRVDVKDQKRAEEILKRIRTRGADSKEGVAACDYCRKRKIKCDREKPSCSRCASAGRVCLTTDTLRKRGPPSKKERELLAAEGIHFVPSRHRKKSDVAGRDTPGDGVRSDIMQGLQAPPLRSSSTSAGAKRPATSLVPSSIGRGRAYTAGGPFVQPHEMDPLPLLKGRRLSLSWVDPSGTRRAVGDPALTEGSPLQQSRALDRSDYGQQDWMSQPNLHTSSNTAPTSASTSSSSSTDQRWPPPGSQGQREGEGGAGGAGVQSGFVRPYQPYEEVPSPHSKSASYYMSSSSSMMHPARDLPGPHGGPVGVGAAQAGQEQQGRWREAEEVSPRSTARFGPPSGGQGQHQGYSSQQ